MENNILDGLSMNIEQTNMDKLKAIFPECFAEGKLTFSRLNLAFVLSVNTNISFTAHQPLSTLILDTHPVYSSPFWLVLLILNLIMVIPQIPETCEFYTDMVAQTKALFHCTLLDSVEFLRV